MSFYLAHLRPKMTSTWTSEREEEFVAMMEAKPELFDTTEMNFSNKTVKMNAWLEMAEHFGLGGKQTPTQRFTRRAHLTALPGALIRHHEHLSDPHRPSQTPSGLAASNRGALVYPLRASPGGHHGCTDSL